MAQPLLPLPRRLVQAVPFGVAWFLLPYLSGGRHGYAVVLGAVAAAIHFTLWFIGPGARVRAPRQPDAGVYPPVEDGPEGPFPIWVERRE
jgi:hypothetical protein